MGASANEIERQIEETRNRMDQNLGVLEDRAASSAVRYGRIAAVAVGALAVLGAGFLVYRRIRKPTLKRRLTDGFDRVSVDSLRDLVGEMRSRLKKPLPSVTLTVNERSAEPRTVESIVRKVAPAIVGTASTVLLERVARAGKGDTRRTAPPAG
jgi:hypothetical protein